MKEPKKARGLASKNPARLDVELKCVEGPLGFAKVSRKPVAIAPLQPIASGLEETARNQSKPAKLWGSIRYLDILVGYSPCLSAEN